MSRLRKLDKNESQHYRLAVSISFMVTQNLLAFAQLTCAFGGINHLLITYNIRPMEKHRHSGHVIFFGLEIVNFNGKLPYKGICKLINFVKIVAINHSFKLNNAPFNTIIYYKEKKNCGKFD